MNEPDLDFRIATLGTAGRDSPLAHESRGEGCPVRYVNDDDRLRYDIRAHSSTSEKLLIERAGPRSRVYFDPAQARAGIVTCGGLCPGLNDVIRAIVMTLWYRYGVRDILGFRYGYRGLVPAVAAPPMPLEPDNVVGIHQSGGTILGSGRGYGERLDEILACLVERKINMLFTIGGDGTQRGAMVIPQAAAERGLPLAVVGVPKTIDNDLSFIERSFGFETAVQIACDAVAAAHAEATGAINGVGLVKLMGRQSGFVAAHTALANNDANYVLVPEIPFDMDGDHGLLNQLGQRLDRRGHAVIVVAEGAGQEYVTREGVDASGNRILGDIGSFLSDRINRHAQQRQREVHVKYIDPSYMIRAAAANADDSIYCSRLGANAAHAAMAGKTMLLVSLLHAEYVHIPMAMAVLRRHCIDPHGSLWRDVVGATGQSHLRK